MNEHEWVRLDADATASPSICYMCVNVILSFGMGETDFISLISAFVVRCLKRIVSLVFISETITQEIN